MQDMLSWWFDWGAIIFLVMAILVAALVLFDAASRRRRNVIGWQLAVILPPILILPSVILKTQLDKGVIDAAQQSTLQGIAGFFLWLGALAGLVAVIAAIGYFMTFAAQPAGGRQGGGQVIIRRQDQDRRPVDDRTKTRISNGGSHVERRHATAMLYLRNGPAGPRDYRLYVGRTTLGRAVECDIMVDDPDVSRDHASIQQTNGRFAVVDHGSTHGTYLNDQRLRGQAYLEDGDEIRLGPTAALLFKQF